MGQMMGTGKQLGRNKQRTKRKMCHLAVLNYCYAVLVFHDKLMMSMPDI